MRVLVLVLCLLSVSEALARPVGDTGVVRFVYADSSARNVSIAGDFNGWNPSATPLDLEGGVWTTRVFLDPGVHEYKFHVDGTWRVDADNPEVSSQGNSVVRVGDEGVVLPPRPTPPAGEGAATSAGATRDLAWSVRYLGQVEARRQRRRFDLEQPQHDIDLRLEARLAPEVTAWFLGNVNNLEDGVDSGGTEWRYDRGALQWTPGPYAVQLFDDVAATSFDDPASLVGRVGIYGDAFGYGRRGGTVRRRLLGAPLEIVYADDAEAGVNRPPETALPDLHGAGAPALAGRNLQRYVAGSSDRNADAFAFRARGGTDELGIGAVYRLDRGSNAGRLAEARVESVADTLRGSGFEFETTENWQAWGVDVRLGWRRLRLAAEFLDGRNRARAAQVARIQEWRQDGAGTLRHLGDPATSDRDFELDTSRRAVLQLQRAQSASQPPSAESQPVWTQRPGTETIESPRLEYAYEEHDFSALVTGTPFLMRRHTLGFAAAASAGGTQLRFDAEQNWFDYPGAATWETQFWFRRHNFWLDEDTAGFERLALLGTDRASIVRLGAARVLWPRYRLRGETTLVYAAPGLDRAPRYVENVLRLTLPVASKLELRTHSRLATYRQFETDDAAILSSLGPGRHVEAGELHWAAGARVTHAHRSFGAHFVELVYTLSTTADLALGFGVDPIVVYPVTNEFADIGWDAFLFERGASPQDAFARSQTLSRRIEDAERALERERRLGLEARVRF